MGAAALSAGVIAGGFLGFDGVRSGTPSLLFVGAVVVFVGAGFDFVMALLLEGLHGRVSLEVYASAERNACASGVEISDADNFIDALATRIAIQG
ncbi:MAG: hypothetical protein IPK60_05330 [Sandaracinaceae bacterium]|nr:hypothetical protein [Sandaracinaceae bacterium]